MANPRVTFRLNHPKDSFGNLKSEMCPILVEFYYKNIRTEPSTRLKAYPANFSNGRVTSKEKDFKAINTELSRIETDILEAYKNNRHLSVPEIKAAIKAIVQPEEITHPEQPVEKKTASLEQFIIEYIARCEKFKLRKAGTITGYTQTLNCLTGYATKESIELTFEAITLDFYYGFTAYLWDILGHTDNTVGKHVKNLKAFMEESFEDDLHTNVAFKKKKFRKPGHKADNVYVTSDEIVRIYGLDLSDNKQLAIHRDLFVFNCWVGVRFGDLCKIRPEQIRQMSDGKYLQLITEKTGEDVTIPFHPLAEAIYSYYNNQLPKLRKDESVVYNRHLKTICELAKINTVSRHTVSIRGEIKTEFFPKFELVSAHTSRRSFATNCYKMGVPPMDIMAVTGHKTEKAFLRYICVTKEEHAKRMMVHFNKTPITNLMRIAN
jgi:integrase